MVITLKTFVGELQMNCIQLVVNQGSKMMGLRLLAMHIFNLMLRGSLLVCKYMAAFYVVELTYMFLWPLLKINSVHLRL